MTVTLISEMIFIKSEIIHFLLDALYVNVWFISNEAKKTHRNLPHLVVSHSLVDETKCVRTSQLRPVKPWLQVQVYSQVSSGLPAAGRARQKPPLRQGRPSQGSGRGVAWVGVGSAGAGVSGANWNGEGTAPILLLRSMRRKVMLRTACVGRQEGTAGTLHTLTLIFSAFFSSLFSYQYVPCLSSELLLALAGSAATERCVWESERMLSLSCAQRESLRGDWRWGGWGREGRDARGEGRAHASFLSGGTVTMIADDTHAHSTPSFTTFCISFPWLLPNPHCADERRSPAPSSFTVSSSVTSPCSFQEGWTERGRRL